MSKVSLLKSEIESLPPRQYKQIRKWFSEKEWADWDKEIEADADAGKLDFLVREAQNKKSLKAL